MDNRNKVILFGNGFNRLNESNGANDWKHLLKSLTTIYDYTDVTSNTLRYEAIYLSDDIKPFQKTDPSVYSSPTEKQLKEEIAKRLQSIQGTNERYQQMANLPVTEYMTTNYDEGLEMTLLDEGYEEIGSDMSEATYSIHRYRRFKKGDDVKRVWHIHGYYKYPESIMLGYNHYCGQLSKINEYVKGSYKFKANGMGKIPKIGARLESVLPLEDIQSWIDLFFISDVHIVGYGFDMSEIDLWWILNRRIRILKEERSIVRNRIFFHAQEQKGDLEYGQCADLKECLCANIKDICSKEREKEEELEKRKILEVFGVNYVAYQTEIVNDDYNPLYEKILNDINQKEYQTINEL